MSPDDRLDGDDADAGSGSASGSGSGAGAGAGETFGGTDGDQGTPPDDTCSASSVGGLALDLATNEAVTGSVIDHGSGQTACTFDASAAAMLHVNLQFFWDWGCPIPNAGTNYGLQLTGASSGRTSVIELAYQSSPPIGTADVRIGFLDGMFNAAVDEPLDHFWVNNGCNGVVVENSAAIGGAPGPQGPLVAVEAVISP